MATNLQKFTLYYCDRRFVAWVLAGNTARPWHADSGKPRTFILSEKKHE